MLAAGSDLFDQMFLDNDPKIITKVSLSFLINMQFSIPKHIAPKAPFVDDPFPKIMAYIYNN